MQCMGAFPKLEEGACISGWVLNCSAVWLSIYYHFSALRKSTLQTSLKPVLSVLLSGMLIIAESNSCTAAFFFFVPSVLYLLRFSGFATAAAYCEVSTYN